MVVPQSVKDDLRDAINTQNAVKTGQLCDRLRFEYGLTYAAQMALVEDLKLSKDDFEELLYESDRSN